MTYLGWRIRLFFKAALMLSVCYRNIGYQFYHLQTLIEYIFTSRYLSTGREWCFFSQRVTCGGVKCG